MANARKPDQNPLSISHLAVSGLKSISDKQSIDIKPLTILAGVNSSGKSSIMKSLLLLKQTLEATYDPGPLLIKGPNVDFNQSSEMLFRASKKRTSELVFDIGLSDKTEISVTYNKNKKGSAFPFDIFSQILTSKGRTDKITKDADGIELFKKIASHPDYDFLSRLFKDLDRNPTVSIVRNRCFLEARLGLGPDEQANYFVAYSPQNIINAIDKIIHLPGLRGNPERAYPKTSVGDKFSGVFQNYVAGVISSWGDNKDERLRLLGEDLNLLGLTWKVEVNSINDTQVEIKVGRLPKSKQGGAKDLVNIADVGFGVSQTLPVAVALLTAKPGQLVYIEQPEIHLHPRAQHKIAILLSTAAKRGVQVVVETHSSLTLLGVQSLVAEGTLDPAKIALHWFKRSDDMGKTIVTSSNLDTYGRFGDWPEDFAEVSLAAEQQYLDTVETRMISEEELYD